MKKKHSPHGLLSLFTVAMASVLFLTASCEKTDSKQLKIKVTGKYEHPQLHNPSDVIQFKGKFVTTELFKNRLAIFDDLNFTNIRHFDPRKIGKRFRSPHFLAISPWDTLVISNGWGNSIVEIEDLDGKGWKEFKGIGKKFNAPHGICVDQQGWIYVGDSLNSRLVRFKDMAGKDWQVFTDLDKKISYIRELVCKENGVWISNSYEKRKGLNKGNGANLLKLTDFESGKVQEIYSIQSSNITGLIPRKDQLIYNLFVGSSVQNLNLSSSQVKLTDIVKKGSTGMGVPYGTFSSPTQNLYLITFYGDLKDRTNLGGILSLEELPRDQPDGITWTMINVNNTRQQGDAHLIQVIGGNTILIDTGFPQLTASEVVPYLKQHKIDVLDAVYLTHGHVDHYGGLGPIIQAGITIKQAWFNPLNESMCALEARCYYDRYLKIQKTLAELGTEVHTLQKGDQHDLGQGAHLKVIYAFDGISTPVKSRNVNDTSAIFLVEYSGYKFLFTGDLNRSMGTYLTKHATDIKADVLKVPHHGAEGLAPNEFFAKVRPRYALVPAPKHLWESKRVKRVREWFSDKKIPVYVNGISGHVQVIVKNGELNIQEQFPQQKKKVSKRSLKLSKPEKGEFEQAGYVDGVPVITKKSKSETGHHGKK